MKLVLLAGDGPSTNILRNYLEENGFAEIETIIEEPPSRKAMLAHRRRKLGIIPIIGLLRGVKSWCHCHHAF